MKLSRLPAGWVLSVWLDNTLLVKNAWPLWARLMTHPFQRAGAGLKGCVSRIGLTQSALYVSVATRAACGQAQQAKTAEHHHIGLRLRHGGDGGRREGRQSGAVAEVGAAV